MKSFFLVIIIFFSFLSCNKDDTNDYNDYETRVEYIENLNYNEFMTSNSLNVITWNINLTFGIGKNPWSEDIGGEPEFIDSIAQLLLSYNPDIVLLQEVPYDRENTIIKKVLDSIAVKMNYNYAFGGHGYNSNGAFPTNAQWGNAILSKFSIANIQNREVFNLNDIWSRRSVLKATMEYKPNKFIDAYSLHYSFEVQTEEEFLEQVYITKEFYMNSINPLIVGGDFNTSKYNIEPIFDLINCLPADYDGIDQIYVSNQFDILDSYKELQVSYALSDHAIGLVKLLINE